MSEHKIGYLSPDGTFYSCSSYGHMDKARELCKELYGVELYNGVDAEKLLYSNGFVVFYAREVGFWRFGDNEPNLLSPSQKYFLMDAEKNCDLEEKRKSIKELLLFNDSVNN